MDIILMAMVSLGTGMLVGFVAGCYIYCNERCNTRKGQY